MAQEDPSVTNDANPPTDDAATTAEAQAAQAVDHAAADDADTAQDDSAGDLPDFAMSDPGDPGNIELLKDVELDVKIELGRVEMSVDSILRLSEGSVVELDKLAGDPVDVMVNDQLVARGEVLVGQ